MAGSDFFNILVTGRQSHGSRPRKGIDPIVVAAEIVSSLQTIVSRQTDITDLPAVVTVGEDFAYIARTVPSVHWWVGITPPGSDRALATDNHSDHFFVDEAGLQVGLRSLLHVAIDFLQGGTLP